MSDSEQHLGVGDRLSKGPAREMVASAFSLEAADGPALYHGMSLADLAHVLMLLEQSVIPEDEGRQLLSALLEIHKSPALLDPALDDVHTWRRSLLHEHCPDSAGWLQTGRPRREASTIAWLMLVRSELIDVTRSVVRLAHALLDRSQEHLETIMPDYTYLQIANPTTLAHYLTGFVSSAIRDLDRLKVVFEHTNVSPAGSGSTNGSRIPVDRTRLADLLGFASVAEHTRDAMWKPDLPIEIMSVATTAAVNGARLAEDLQIWATSEFGFIELSDSHSRISVIMPQKKNPFGLTYVRGVSRSMIGHLASTAALQATSTGQPDNRIFSHGEVTGALQKTAGALNLMADIVDHLTVNESAMESQASKGFSASMDIADEITLRFGINSGISHRILGIATRRAIEAQSDLTAVLIVEAAEEIGMSIELTDEDLNAFADPEKIIATRTVQGGAAESSTREMIVDFRERVRDAGQWASRQSDPLAEVEYYLIEEARSFVDTSD